MGEPTVLGILLKVETIGYTGPPPSMPNQPMSVKEGGDGRRCFVYDLSPREADLDVADACLRLGSRLERLVNSPKSPLPRGQYAVRCSLEFGILADRDDESFSYAWPLDFLRTLVEADITLNVSHYLPTSDNSVADGN